MFRFANPQYLWLLLAVPVLLILFGLAARSRRKRLERFGRPEVLGELMPEGGRAGARSTWTHRQTGCGPRAWKWAT